MSRLGLRMVSSGVWLDVPTGMRLRVIRENNIFFEGRAARDRSWPIELPPTEANDMALSHLRSPYTENATTAEHLVDVYNGGNRHIRGLLVVERTQRSYKCSVDFDRGTIPDWKLDTLIRDVDYPDMTVDYGSGNHGEYPDYDACSAPTYLFGDGTYGGPYIGDTHETFQAAHDGSFKSAFGAIHLFSILRGVFDFLGYTTREGSFFDDTELQQLTMVAHTDPNSIYTQGTSPNGKQMPQRITVRQLIESLRNLFCLAVEYDSNTDKVTVTLLRDAASNAIQADWTTYRSGKWERVWKTSPFADGYMFQFAKDEMEHFGPENLDTYKHLYYVENDNHFDTTPGLDFGDDIAKCRMDHVAYLWLKYTWQDTPDWDGNWNYSSEPTELDQNNWTPHRYLGYYGDLMDAVLLADVDEHTDLPTGDPVDSLRLVVKENWIYRQNGGDTWVRHCFDVRSVKEGTGAVKIESQILPAPVQAIYEDLDVTMPKQLFIIVKNHLNGTLKEYWGAPYNLEDLPALLMFNRGESDYGVSYPETRLTTPMRHDVEYTEMGDYTLRWHGDDGLKATFWDPWLAILEAMQESDLYMHLTQDMIESMDWLAPVLIDNQKCYIKRMEYDLPLTAPVKVTVARVN